MRSFVFGVVAFLSLAPVATARQERTAEVTADIVYTTVDGRELKLDLAQPAARSDARPAIVAIHGGAWRAGNKSDLRNLLVEFAEAGYVAISPEYRFCPEHTFPAQVHDVKAAVRWLRANAETYGVDPDRIGAVGFSAGGHLALMLGLTDPSGALEGPVPEDAPASNVQAVVNFFGPTDLLAEDLPMISIPLRNDFIGGTPEEKPEATAAASPITHVSRGDAPILVFQGTADPLIPTSQATTLAAAMAEAGVPGRVELIVGAGHGVSGPELPRTKEATFEFFDLHLKSEGAVPAFLKP
ncbi:alpha/beta hydrolase [Tautonia rosea]|uniref:alpha/beta hydrolase n=1 Tax=Tautonia rosea TaxID=2728037 RepID=UPI0014752C45|nr:alpha/beta hydrolase [Tautonia rosea]